MKRNRLREFAIWLAIGAIGVAGFVAIWGSDVRSWLAPKDEIREVAPTLPGTAQTPL